MGDFSMSGVNDLRSHTAVANPNFQSHQAGQASESSIIRSIQFNGEQRDSADPHDQAPHHADKYIPQPNMMRHGPHDHDGQSTVVGAASIATTISTCATSITQDQGTVRVDHIFANGDTSSGRYSVGAKDSAKHGFMPQNLPGFGAFHDNLSQQGNHRLESRDSVRTWSTLPPLRFRGCPCIAPRRKREQERHRDAAGYSGHWLRRSRRMGRAVLQRAGLFTGSATLLRPRPCTPGTR